MEIAIVEDDKEYVALISSYIERYGEKSGQHFELSIFSDGMNFVSDYTPVYDIIFMDIEMPYMDGLEAARRIRLVDSSVVILFVTNMAQYAIHGYEVRAIDFIVKPLEYFNFSDKLKKAISFVSHKIEQEILIGGENWFVKVAVSDILYVEKEKNYVMFHTINRTYKKRALLAEVEEELGNSSCFSKNNSGCIVNLKHVDETGTNTITVKGEILPLARRRRQEFIADFMKYLSGQRRSLK